MENESSSSESAWEQIAPLLNDALGQLSEVDRCAVILRFFESKSFQQIGSALGTTEGAAKMRLSRAMEKLREIFQKRGVVVPAGALLVALSTHAAEAAPAGLASSIVASALLKTATTSMLTKGILVMATAKQKIGIAAAVTALALAGGGTMGFIGYRLSARAHAGEAARGDARPPDSRPPAVAAQEPVTVAFSNGESDDQQKAAGGAIRQIKRRFVVREGDDADPGKGDVMVLNGKLGTNEDGTTFSAGGGTVVVRKRSGRRVQAFAPGAPGSGGEAGGEGYGIAPAPVAPTPVPPPER